MNPVSIASALAVSTTLNEAQSEDVAVYLSQLER